MNVKIWNCCWSWTRILLFKISIIIFLTTRASELLWNLSLFIIIFYILNDSLWFKFPIRCLIDDRFSFILHILITICVFIRRLQPWIWKLISASSKSRSYLLIIFCLRSKLCWNPNILLFYFILFLELIYYCILIVYFSIKISFSVIFTLIRS